MFNILTVLRPRVFFKGLIISTLLTGKVYAQEASLPVPLRYADETVSNFGLGLEINPTILPGGNLLASISLLGRGIYYSKFAGRAKDGSLIYGRPHRLNYLSNEIEDVKVVYLDNKPEIFVLTQKDQYWQHCKLEENGDSVRISERQQVMVNGKPLTGDFSMVNIQGRTVVLKPKNINSGLYWPHNQNPWEYPPNPDIGFNKGYDLKGQWLGQETATYVDFAEQQKDQKWTFGTWKAVTQKGKPFSMNAFSSPIKLVCLNLLEDQRQQILFSSDVDKFSLFALTISGEELEFEALALPPGLDKRTKETYFSMPVTSTSPLYNAQGGFVVGGNPGILIEYYPEENEWKHRPVLMKGGDLHVETLAVPNWIDWDNDGVPDLVAGDSSGFLWFFKNIGSGQNPSWALPQKLFAGGQVIHHQAGYSGSIQGPNERRWGYLQPLVCDWDNDGLLDVVCNDITGYHVVYKNIGKKGSPVLAKAVPLIYNGKQFKAAWRSKPACLPVKYLANTGWALAGYIAINGKGELCLYQRGKTNPNLLLNEEVLLNTDEKPVRIVGYAGHEGRATLGICDYNKDGVWDIIFGQGVHMSQSKVAPGALPFSTAYVMINKGTNAKPHFDLPKPLCQANGQPINLDRHGCWISPVLNKTDQLTDLLIGAEDGRFYMFKQPQLCQTP